MAEKLVGKPPKFWIGVGLVAGRVLLLLVIRFGLAPSYEDFWPSVVVALIPAVGGIIELIRWLRWRKRKNEAWVQVVRETRYLHSRIIK